MLFSPIIAAILLIKKSGNNKGVRLLLKRILDYQKIPHFIWYIAALLLLPVLMYLTYLSMLKLGIAIPNQNMDLFTPAILFILFFIGAICEEVGWTGYITDPLQNQFGAFNASILLGVVWAVWHIIPYIQAERNFIWIFWQSVVSVAIRIIIVWLYNNAGKSLFAAILCHTTGNMSQFLFPNYGSNYNPFYFGIILTIAVLIIVLLWDVKTFSWFRFNHPG